MKKKNNIISILLLVAIVLILFVFSGARSNIRSFMSGFFSPVLSHLSSSGKNLRENLSFIRHIGDLRSKNNELSEKILSLQVDTSRISELENENTILKKELGFAKDSSTGPLIPAKIIERDPMSYLDYVIVDRGSDDGLKSGMAVVSSGTLVGQVREVMKNTSTVVLITSKDSIIQAMLQDCRAKGILKGGNSGLYIENITRDTEYKEGEFVITSGLGGKIKEGILIGKADKLQSSSSGIFKTISVEPLLDLSKLELVFIQQ
jgi:rod shape-determining protein MreC